MTNRLFSYTILLAPTLLTIAAAPTSAAGPVRSHAAIESLLNEPDAPRTVESFLETLATRDPELFSGFTLMRESQSLQSATPDAPRAIVFGRDGKFILTFNGKSGQSRHDHIEMMQFVETAPTTGRFELREIEFSNGGAEPARLSPPNPAKCARCHGTDPKPLWEEYDRWPGAYGEEDDALIDFDDSSRFPTTADADNKIVARHRQHLAEFRSFMAARPAHSRYRWLRFPEGTGSPVAPYIPTIRSGKEPLRPNLLLTHLFSELNAKRVARKMVESGEQCFKTAAPVAAALLIDCDKIESLKPVAKSVIAKMREAEVQMQKTAPAGTQSPVFSIRNPSLFQDGRIFVLQAMGLSDFDWSPARLKRQWQYFQGFKDISDDILAAIWPQLTARGFNLEPYEKLRAELHPDYYTYTTPGSGSDAAPYQDHLDGLPPPMITAREAACRELTGDFANINAERLERDCSPKKNSPGEKPPVIRMCMSCHDGTGAAPKLPLDDPAAVSATHGLKEKVRERLDTADPALRMPPDRPLSPSEWQSIADFLY